MSRLRQWSQLKYYVPRKILLGLREISLTLPLDELPKSVSTLRSRNLREYGESRQCALFCYGVSRALGMDVSFAHHEAADHDFIAAYRDGEDVNYVPVQMKEFVPTEVNAKATLQAEIDKLEKYVDAADLCVAVHLNRAVRVEFGDLRIPKLNIGELWLFGATSLSQENWILVGNLLADPKVYEFEYPRI